MTTLKACMNSKNIYNILFFISWFYFHGNYQKVFQIQIDVRFSLVVLLRDKGWNSRRDFLLSHKAYSVKRIWTWKGFYWAWWAFNKNKQMNNGTFQVSEMKTAKPGAQKRPRVQQQCVCKTPQAPLHLDSPLVRISKLLQCHCEDIS